MSPSPTLEKNLSYQHENHRHCVGITEPPCMLRLLRRFCYPLEGYNESESLQQ